MTEADADIGLERFAREEDVASFRRAAEARRQTGETLGRPRGVLTAEMVAARHAGQVATEPGSLSVETRQPAAPFPPPDETAALRHFRLGVVAILVLVALLLWLRQRLRAS